MGHRVFVKVVGFSEVERHALNTAFRLSGQRDLEYSPWEPHAPEPPKLALVDGSTAEAVMETASLDGGALKLIWVGDAAPQYAVMSFRRPIAWPEVLEAMDGLFTPPAPLDVDLDFDLDSPAPAPEPLDIDFDLDLGTAQAEPDTGPDTEPGTPAELPVPARRALIVAANLEDRLYWRARMALANLTLADEAATGAQALEMARTHPYAVAMVDFGLADGGWPLVKALRTLQPEIPNLVLVKDRPSLTDGLRSWLHGVPGFFYRPLHPRRLNARLRQS